MFLYFCGVMSFVCMLIYDIGCCKKSRLTHIFSPLSGLILATALVLGCSNVQWLGNAKQVIFSILALAGAVVLVYTVFFAVGNSLGSLVDTGIYAICRHPGFWILLFLCVCLNLSFSLAWEFTLMTTVLNLMLVLYEDLHLFPKMIAGYDDYKQNTPFLFPNLLFLINRKVK